MKKTAHLCGLSLRHPLKGLAELHGIRMDYPCENTRLSILPNAV